MVKYIAVLGFSILQCLLAMNITDDSQARHEIPDNLLTEELSWYQGFSVCRHEKNTTNEVNNIMGNKTYIAELVNIHGPLWIYGLEITVIQHKKKTVFRISRRDPSQHAVCICWSKYDPIMSIETDRTYTEAATFCQNSNHSLPVIEPTNITEYDKDILIRSPFWVPDINENLFINDDAVEVRCVLYDKNGELRTDNCTSKRRTLCSAENASPVVEYVNNVTLPWLQTKSSTGTSSTKSNRTKSHGPQKSNDTKLSSSSSTSSTPSSSSSRTTSGIFMDQQIQITVISVGGAIVIAIVVAICICCCKRKKQNSPVKRQSAKLADNYSETVDSMAMKEQSIYETPNNSEYATPDDAIRKARHRQSIGENEYDVINTEPKKKKSTGVAANAYNHVTLVSSKDKQNISNLDENQYDVTNYGRQTTVLISTNDDVGHEYGHVDIKVER